MLNTVKIYVSTSESTKQNVHHLLHFNWIISQKCPKNLPPPPSIERLFLKPGLVTGMTCCL